MAFDEKLISSEGVLGMHLIGDRQVPDPLVTLNEQVIQTATEWEKVRREEVLDLFATHVYGKPSVNRPDSLLFNVVDQDNDAMDGMAIHKIINISYEGSNRKGSFNLYLYIPKNIQGPVPTFLFINNRKKKKLDFGIENNSDYWPATYIIDQGYATATFHVSEIANDDAENAYEGSVQHIFDGEDNSSPDSWKTIAAWAWGASRCMDYFETDPNIQVEQVAVVGHSRGGKTALWAGARDKRFAYVVSNDSGCTGAAITRGKVGETVEMINTNFPHWFCDNYKMFNKTEEELPVDQHMLLSLIAPRPVNVASSSNDTTADPQSEFLSLLYAQPVYELYGKGDFPAKHFPANDTPLFGSRMGYHVRTGDHSLTRYDWKQFIAFWESID